MKGVKKGIPNLRKPEMPDMWTWFLIKPKYATEEMCFNTNTKLCVICQDDCNLARGHGLSDEQIYEEWMKIIKES